MKELLNHESSKCYSNTLTFLRDKSLSGSSTFLCTFKPFSRCLLVRVLNISFWNNNSSEQILYFQSLFWIMYMTRGSSQRRIFLLSSLSMQHHGWEGTSKFTWSQPLISMIRGWPALSHILLSPTLGKSCRSKMKSKGCGVDFVVKVDSLPDGV